MAAWDRCWITSVLGSYASEMGPLIRAWLNHVLVLEQDNKNDVVGMGISIACMAIFDSKFSMLETSLSPPM